MKSSLFLLLFLSLLACKPSENKTTASKKQSTEIEKENDLALLYQHYSNNPANQFQIDENKIIDYIAGQETYFERSTSGLYFNIVKSGSGDYINRSHQISAHYKGTFLDGEPFDSSYERNKLLQFKQGQMIAAWNELMPKLRKGDSATLLVPSYLAYGTAGLEGYIEPNETLKFELEIVDLD